ncbi:MAG: hypothetical protein ABIX01_02280 [Chitinophagaceae bacterium]
MAKKLVLTATLFIMVLAVLRADVISEGQIPRYFMFKNLSKQKNFAFTFKFYTYTYNGGYHADTPTTVICKDDQHYLAGERFDKTKLEATDGVGNNFMSDVDIGGDIRVADRNIKEVVDVYSVVSIKDGIIKLKKVNETTVYYDGREKKRKSEVDGVAIGSGNKPAHPMLIAGALAAFIALVLLFLKKRKNELVSST